MFRSSERNAEHLGVNGEELAQVPFIWWHKRLRGLWVLMDELAHRSSKPLMPQVEGGGHGSGIVFLSLSKKKWHYIWCRCMTVMRLDMDQREMNMSMFPHSPYAFHFQPLKMIQFAQFFQEIWLIWLVVLNHSMIRLQSLTAGREDYQWKMMQISVSISHKFIIWL